MVRQSISESDIVKHADLRRFDTTKTINDGDDGSSSSEDSFIDSSEDESDLEIEEKML